MEFVVVRCAECALFQTRQTRLDNRFACGVCSSRQSIRKVYARSASASHLRPVVQEMNGAAASADVRHDPCTDEDDVKHWWVVNPRSDREISRWAVYLNAEKDAHHHDHPIDQQSDGRCRSPVLGKVTRLDPSAKVVLASPHDGPKPLK
ncbi:unnamed protein product (mitochondrion) [Plasmodiophora brassicae]|uniref:MRN complex-interacting protein N-terminal domain-containing protein n=2 Tax=Plasmodiophora brassicae TaxID=37360 RepID=A0A3P3YCY5_PLABS|nr:unnamed protein product [Plasmodiophora brassicae]